MMNLSFPTTSQRKVALTLAGAASLAISCSCIAATTLSGPVWSNNLFRFTINGESQYAHIIEVSSNLQTWTPVLVNSRPRVDIFDAPPGASFYRARRGLLIGFAGVLAARGPIDLSGNNILIDSFDSSDPLFSTGGLYDANKAKAHGDVATSSANINCLNIGDARVKGTLHTAPGGSAALGGSGSVGDAAWVGNLTPGIQPGHFYDDMDTAYPDVTLPFVAWQQAVPVNTNIGGVNFKFYLTGGNWQIDDLSGSVYVASNSAAVVYVPATGTLTLNGQEQIQISSGGSLLLYAGPASVFLGGKGINNTTGNATNFTYLGLASNTSLQFGANTPLTGRIYCPSADFILNGGGGNGPDFVGAFIANTISVSGNFNFHYDEQLNPFRAEQ